MKRNNIIYFAFSVIAALAITACTPNAPSEESCYFNDEQVAQWIADGQVYNLNDFVDKYMTETGDYDNYRTRSYYSNKVDGKDTTIFLFSINDIPADGPGIYIRGRIATDDYGGNFYKALVLQQIVDGEQQTLRLSVDIGSASGLYQKGQEVIIRCNGLSIGRYANQPQLCVPSYNNNIYAHSANAKIGWAPGRIPAPRFREVCKLIGRPDASQLLYEEMSLPDLYTKYLSTFKMNTWADIKKIRQIDGHLVRITGVCFTGSFDDQGSTENCVPYEPATDSTAAKGDPTVDGSNAYVFAPSTGNVGYPQSRYIRGGSKLLLVSASEYAKYAHFYLPPKKYVGYVQGVLGYYLDQPPTENYPLSTAKWSVAPNNLQEDILPDCQNAEDEAKRWVPQEWVNGVPQDMSDY